MKRATALVSALFTLAAALSASAATRTPGEGVASVRLHVPARHDERVRRSPAAANHPAGALVAGAAPDPAAGLDLRTRVEALERDLLLQALEESKHNQSRAARLLGLSRFGLLKKMKRYGIS